MPEIDIIDGDWVIAPREGRDLLIDTSGTGGDIWLKGQTVADELIKLNAADGADAANALLMGIGTTADPASTSTAGKFFIEVRAKSTATSGDNRLCYFRYDIDGAGASGEALRAFTDLGAAAATARGAHISLQAGATGYITGLGVGVDAQLYVKNEVLAGGTYAALNAEIYSEGSTTAVSGVTSLSALRVVLGGDSTGAGRVDDKAYLITLTGGANGSGNIVGAVGNEPTWTSKTHLIRCSLNGTDVYLVGVQL